jgi:putative DNA primase/helicase
LLQELLAGFPFDGDVDKSVAIAAILTVVLRGAFKTAPAFFIRAPETGTGKTYLVMVISTIATGRIAPALVGAEQRRDGEAIDCCGGGGQADRQSQQPDL